jgi:hypothetical protein
VSAGGVGHWAIGAGHKQAPQDQNERHPKGSGCSRQLPGSCQQCLAGSKGAQWLPCGCLAVAMQPEPQSR